MKTIQEIRAAIIDEAQTMWEKSNGMNWHRLVLTPAGEIYWTEDVGQHSMPESVWTGTNCSLAHFQGQTYNGADEDVYQMVEATPEIAAEMDEHGEGVASDGNSYRKGSPHYGYNPEKWYYAGDLLPFEDANQDTSAEEYMAGSIEIAEEFWAAQKA